MSQTWIRVGLDDEPYTSPQPGTLGSHHSRISGRFDCPAALRAIAGAALSPTVSSSSPKSRQGPPVTGSAASASRLFTQVGRRSKEACWVPSRFMGGDIAKLDERPFHDLWDDHNYRHIVLSRRAW